MGSIPIISTKKRSGARRWRTPVLFDSRFLSIEPTTFRQKWNACGYAKLSHFAIVRRMLDSIPFIFLPIAIQCNLCYTNDIITSKGHTTMDLTTLEHLGLSHVLQRGTGEILEEHESALLLRDTVSEIGMLACEDVELGLSILDRHADTFSILMVSNPKLGEAACSRYGFADHMECYQVAYYGKMPPLDDRLTFRRADLSDLPVIVANYHALSEKELKKVVEQKSMLVGYYEDHLVGFIGEHLEGSMGLLFVYPEYRRMGFAAALENAKIAELLKKGILPFAQIDKNNLPSLRLQEKLGMTRSEHTIMFLWRR